MQLELSDGRYIIAVSGGIDSIVLLDLLVKLRTDKKRQLDFIVAHYDHGIRSDSKEDRLFVEELAKAYDLPFVYSSGNLGPETSEETARNARYNFLNKVLEDKKAVAIITAHHQDDLIETAILNVARGTGRRGLTSLKSSGQLLRPLLKYPKLDIINYATNNNLVWHEDSTNLDLKYSRNYIRHQVLPKIDEASRAKLLDIINGQDELNDQIDKSIAGLLDHILVGGNLSRLWFNSLDSKLSKEVIAAWLRLNGLYSYDRSTLERLNSDLKVAKAGSLIDALSGYRIKVGKDNLALMPIER